MEIQITRGKKNGKGFMTVLLEGKSVSNFEASRKLTGTFSESGAGIFNSLKASFVFGEERKDFTFNELDFMNDSSQKIREELKKRIETVRAWVDSVDYEETFKFSV